MSAKLVKKSIYAQITGLSLTLLVFSRMNFFKTSETYIYMDDHFSFIRETAVKCMWNVGKMGSFNLFYRGVQDETNI